MLCTIAIRRHIEEPGVELYTLRITGKTALGPSTTGGRDSKDFESADAFYRGLVELGVTEDVLAAAREVMLFPEHHRRFVNVAEDVQIPFEVLERADFSLFD